ncbi:MAG: hypothetical protein NTW21_10855 [Verrucomicrobia bacterium]|nr:hypothetical protein [Verrucomicrobiota bacterium]
MQPPALLLLAALGCLAAVSCAWLGMGKPAATEDPATHPRLVGRIASIPADRRFVLIQSYGKWEVASGSVLVTRGPEERSANLLTTGETLGQFAAADLQSGTPEVGDAVFLLPAATRKTATDTPNPTPTPPPGESPRLRKPLKINEPQMFLKYIQPS